MSEKTEQPTESRLRQERRAGRISKSRDLTQAVAGAAWPLALALSFDFVFGAAVRVLHGLFELIGEERLPDSVRMDFAMSRVIVPTIALSVGVAAAGAAISIALELMQTKGLLSMKPVTPNFGKLNPINQLKSIFSLRTLVELAKNLVKVAAVGACTLVVIRVALPDLAAVATVDLPSTLNLTTSLLFRIATASIAVLVALAVIDVGYQRYEYIKGLKMTKDEVKRDYKQQEGDPLVKGERRRQHAELADR
ncbi:MULTISPECIES: EscU/YscU/HrcU family type III secretion system export apparatus switch protein [Burkholderia]|uniref:Type III secretion protein n=1 Tax=Burkholderia mayonis TaxID=1385591 RepID=A0A1B4FJ75_9BURK|nr:MULTISPECIES: EscU/YscU/HrcU family type III secretion system export apparatus switch protein [Burkholderia]AOJ03743.1 type III secretion protein [Burkholderia mayonis]KVE41582.1 type III secretion protein [Burkholderia sp. BDU5]KVE46911.1 type III secretion protein [Burkholderia mayonis]